MHAGRPAESVQNAAQRRPATSGQLAQRAGITERYAREWLAGLAAAGYLDYDPDTTAYTLPAEHAPVLAEEGGAVFFGGVYQIIDAALAVLDQIASNDQILWMALGEVE